MAEWRAFLRFGGLILFLQLIGRTPNWRETLRVSCVTLSKYQGRPWSDSSTTGPFLWTSFLFTGTYLLLFFGWFFFVFSVFCGWGMYSWYFSWVPHEFDWFLRNINFTRFREEFYENMSFRRFWKSNWSAKSVMFHV